jgi:hypothetical protein
MATTEALLEHLAALRRSVTDAMVSANGYKEYGDMMTSANKATHLAKVTTVPADRLHASDCAVCTAWDGSSA